MIELHATYEQTDTRRRFIQGRVLDVTLRCVAPEGFLYFNANVGYDFTTISTMALLVNQNRNLVRSSSEPLHDELIECIRCLSSTMNPDWFPRYRRVIALFNELNVNLNQAWASFAFGKRGVNRALYPPMSFPFLMEFGYLRIEQGEGCTVKTYLEPPPRIRSESS